MAAFRKAIENGMSESDAASLAKNLTVNFNRKGELSPAINALYMFANAGIQGSARIVGALATSKRVRKMMFGVTMMAFGLAEMNRLLAGDDDDDKNRWDKVSDYTKQTNLIFKTEDGEFKIRLPYGYNVFVAAGYALSDMVHGSKDPFEVAGFMGSSIMNAFNPLGGDEGLLKIMSPTLVDPLVEIATNENFMGGKIAPENLPWGPQKPDSELYYRSASGISKSVTSFLNSVTGGSRWESGLIDISPETIDHILSFAGGGLGRTIGRVADLPGKAVSGDLQFKDVPFLRQVYTKASPYVDFDLFYANIGDIQTAKASLKETSATDRRAFSADHPELGLYKLSNSYSGRMSKLRKLYYQHRDNGNSAGARDIQEKMQVLAKRFNKIYNARMDR